MDQQIFKQDKRTIREYMAAQYSDERLAMLLAHAQSGRLSHFSCCCFAGIPTAEHALQTEFAWSHGTSYTAIPGGNGASAAYLRLGTNDKVCFDEELRRRIVIPMVRAEMKRRSYAQAKKAFSEQFARDLEAVFA